MFLNLKLIYLSEKKKNTMKPMSEGGCSEVFFKQPPAYLDGSV